MISHCTPLQRRPRGAAPRPPPPQTAAAPQPGWGPPAERTPPGSWRRPGAASACPELHAGATNAAAGRDRVAAAAAAPRFRGGKPRSGGGAVPPLFQLPARTGAWPPPPPPPAWPAGCCAGAPADADLVDQAPPRVSWGAGSVAETACTFATRLLLLRLRRGGRAMLPSAAAPATPG